MGAFTIAIQIGDPNGHRFEEVEALVDMEATLASAPASLLKKLNVSPMRRGTFEFADGRQAEMEIGETRVRVEGVETTTPVLFADDNASPLLGAMTLESLLLGVDPFNQRFVPVTGMLKG